MVSIIVPVYNGEEHLKRCMDSILNQDYPDLELIMVDDGSQDRSWELMSSLAAVDRRVRIIHKENGGVSSARNRGLAEASGDYVQFVDVDDWLPMDATKILVREMESGTVQLVVGDFYRVMERNMSVKGSIEKSGILSRREYADRMMLGPADLYYGVLWNKLYRRGIIERYGIHMDVNISYSEDMIFNLEYLLHVNAVAIVKAPVYYYQYTKGSLVDQSLNLSSTIKMKKSVIGYYNEFFRSTFEAPAYQERLPVIYSYLLAVSRDSLVLPFASKKLSDLSAISGVRQCPLQGAVLGERLLYRYLVTLSRQLGMDTDDLLLLYCMEKLDRPCDTDTLCLLSNLGKTAVILSIARLLAQGLIQQSDGHFAFHAPELQNALQQLDRDVEAICFGGFTDEEISQYQNLEARICSSILQHLQAETATSP